MPVKIKGKLYSTVDERLRAFRESFPACEGWGLNCEILTIDDDQVTLTAKIVDPTGRIVGQGHAQEYRSGSRINSTSMLENAETSAWGRALASIGYFGDGNFAVATADEVSLAISTQEALESDESLSPYGLTITDIDDWCNHIGYMNSWGNWDDKVRRRFLDQLESGELTAQMVKDKVYPIKNSKV